MFNKILVFCGWFFAALFALGALASFSFPGAAIASLLFALACLPPLSKITQRFGSSFSILSRVALVLIATLLFGIFPPKPISVAPSSAPIVAASTSPSPSASPSILPSVQPSQPAASPKASPMEPVAIFAKLKGSTGYYPQIISGAEGRALTVPIKNWKALTPSDRQTVTNYSTALNLKEIIAGEVKDSKTIFMNKTVWTNAKWYNPPASAIASSPSPTPASPDICKKAGGRFFSDVRIYLDAGCTNFYGTVYGGNGEVILLDFHDGSRGLKTRSILGDQSYVRTDDPALSKMEWRKIEN